MRDVAVAVLIGPGLTVGSDSERPTHRANEIRADRAAPCDLPVGPLRPLLVIEQQQGGAPLVGLTGVSASDVAVAVAVGAGLGLTSNVASEGGALTYNRYK